MTDAWSITEGYFDVGGTWHPTPEETRRALRQAMDAVDLDVPPPPPPMRFVAAGSSPALHSSAEIRLEDGTVVAVTSALPPDLPIGYHELTTDGSDPTTLVVSPRVCPDVRRAWGWAVQLYSVRSSRSWGIGDLSDLRDLARWSAAAGAGVVLTNPLHADVPIAPQQPSPYFATSRVWRNITALSVPDLPGAERLEEVLAPLAERGRALNGTSLLDRDAVLAVKRPALEAIFAAFSAGGGDPAFDQWCASRALRLDRFAVFCAIADEHGRAFTEWPTELRHPGTPAVERYAVVHGDRVRFHAWCQWQLERQLAAAGAEGVGIIGDLAVGFEPHGADAWSYQDELALHCRVGAPPDSFNDRGQDWGLPPFVPWKLRAAAYEPFITTVRAALAGCRGLRMDHVMGLFRLYWIPPGGDAADGAYVRYPHRDLFDLLAVEAHRAGAVVIGEDLGTVEDEVREELKERRVLSTKVVWFEEEPPEKYPADALATITTHDLPTVAGVWTGADSEARESLGLAVEGEDAWFRSRLTFVTDAADGTPVVQVIAAAHARLARSPAVIRLATLDDAIAKLERPNMPGTIDEWPNWRIPLHLPLEAIESHSLAREIARSMGAPPDGGAAVPGG